jgi:hypothetical protein
MFLMIYSSKMCYNFQSSPLTRISISRENREDSHENSRSPFPREKLSSDRVSLSVFQRLSAKRRAIKIKCLRNFLHVFFFNARRVQTNKSRRKTAFNAKKIFSSRHVCLHRSFSLFPLARVADENESFVFGLERR